MKYYDKPYFLIKNNMNKSSLTNTYFRDILTCDILKDVCKRITSLQEYDVDFVDNKYHDEYLAPSYNKGRLAILFYKESVYYISFSADESAGRNSATQSVPTAYNIYYQSEAVNKHICFYFLYPTSTNYNNFIYRLMKTLGIEFLNIDILGLTDFIAFNSVEDIIYARNSNSNRNKSNKSTYVTKGDAFTIEVYGKTYGANKYDSSMICYALSALALKGQKIVLNQVMEKNLKRIPQVCREILIDMGKVDIIETDLKFERQEFNDNNSLRSPRFIYNLFSKYGNKKCILCECGIPEIIQGAHIWPVAFIKRRKDFTLEKKLEYATDGENGLWLCENHHRLFDENLIRFDGSGRVVYSESVGKKQREFMEEITKIPEIPAEYLSDDMVQYLEKRYNEAKYVS